MMFEFEVGDFVRYPARPAGEMARSSRYRSGGHINFEEAGKQVIHAEHIALELVAEKTEQARNR